MARPKKHDLLGQRFGKLVVTAEAKGFGRDGTVYWHVLCDCGNSKIVEGPNLRTGNTKSCGCLRTETLKYRKRDALNQKWIKEN